MTTPTSKPMNKWAFYGLLVTAIAPAVVGLVNSIGGREDTTATYQLLRSHLEEVAQEVRNLDKAFDARIDAIELSLARADGRREVRRTAGPPLPAGVAGPPAPAAAAPAPPAAAVTEPPELEGGSAGVLRRIEALPDTL